ncbi:DUF6538 domain-containing protein [Hyphomicrobium sp.]|uniref:DUF6538 domain-containing protein n=1 Tax=Hyphomicrobium sp. TaxID=82 RepID=UPI0025C6AD2C|nr:DUF6538 domain-containing protein [Hyphomicrobium sp.]
MVKPYLPKGSKTYKIHPRVPSQYQGVVGATHVTRSLGTRDAREAKRRAHAVMQELYQEWDKLLGEAVPPPAGGSGGPQRIAGKHGCCFDSVEHACAYMYETARFAEQVKRYEAAERIKTEPEALWRGEIVPLPSVGLDKNDTWGTAARAFAACAADRHRRVSHDLAMGQLAWVEELVRKYFNPPHSEDHEFVFAIANTLLSFWNRVAHDDRGMFWFVDEEEGSFFVRPPHDDLPIGSRAVQKPGPGEGRSPSSTPSLSVLCEAYISERGQSLTNERTETIRATVRDLIAVNGDKEITKYGKDDAKAFKEVLLSVPGNWNKRKGLREYGIVEASRKAAQTGLPRQAPATIRKKWGVLGRLFDYAQRNYEGVINPFSGKSLALGNGNGGNDQGGPFNSDELKKLLVSLHPAMPSHLYWLSLLSLYTGARLNELCQLSKSAILRHGDLHYIYFGAQLRLKERSSIRSVPLHPRLVELGFLEYVESRSDDLFPDLPIHKSGRLSDAPSKAFSRYLRKLGIKRPRLSFHSLRHTFIDALKRFAPRDAEARERLVGHAVQGMAGRYGKGYEAEAHDMELLVEREKVLRLVRF